MPPDLLKKMEAQRGLVRAEQLREAGLHHATVRAWTRGGFWTDVLPRVYGLAGISLDWQRRGQALLLALGEPAWLSHSTAAFLHGLRGSAPALPVEATVPYGRSVRLDGTTWTHVHRTRVYEGDGATEINGLRVTSVERTLLDMASTGATGWSADCVADALRRNLTTISDLYRTIETAGRVAGRHRLRRVVAVLDPAITRARSQPEWSIRDAIVEAGLPAPILNHVIATPDGDRFEIDLAWPKFRLGYEYDSDEYHSTPSELRRDRVRHRRIVQLGWDLRHLSSSDLRSTGQLVGEIRDALVLHGWSDHV